MPRSPSRRRRPVMAASRRGGGSLRLIGGQYRGRRLNIANVDGLRPTGDRQRETLFNWLQFELPGARVLDLFAGTGALGLEAASREAADVWLVERNAQAAQQIRQAIEQLGCHAQVVATDAMQWVAQTDAGPFDVVFIDPPFADEVWQPVIYSLIEHRRLSPGAWVYLESPRSHPLAVPAGLTLRKEKSTGDVRLQLYQWEAG